MSYPLGVSTSENSTFINIDYTPDIAMFVGEFEKGPINEPIFISDILTFKLIFGRAREWNQTEWYQVYTYLQYSSGIWVCRTSGSVQIKASNGNNIVNSPGEWGNIISIFCATNEEYYQNIETTYGKIQTFISHEYVDDSNFVYLVFRNDKLVESFIVNSSEEITSSYLESVELISGYKKMNNGYCSTAKYSDFLYSYELFDKFSYDIDIIIGNDKFNYLAIELAEKRKDCVAFIGLPKEFAKMINVNGKILTTEDGRIIILGKGIINYKYDEETKNSIYQYIKTLPKSEYAFFTIGFKVIKDQFNSKLFDLNIAADIAGLKAKASKIDPWKIGVGVEKGTIINAINTRFDMTQKERDELYKLGVNVLLNNTVLTQKLFHSSKTKVQKLHQRTTLNYIEKTCEKLVRKYVFVQNTYDARGVIASQLKLKLEDLRVSGAIEAGKVHVTKIDEQTININIYIKIPRMIEFINLNFINSGTNNLSNIIIRG